MLPHFNGPNTTCLCYYQARKALRMFAHSLYNCLAQNKCLLIVVIIIIIIIIIVVVIIITLPFFLLLLFFQVFLVLFFPNSQALLDKFLLIISLELSTNQCYKEHRKDGIKCPLLDYLCMICFGYWCLVIVVGHFVSQNDITTSSSF